MEKFNKIFQLAYIKEINGNELKALMVILDHYNMKCDGVWNNTPQKIIVDALGIARKNVSEIVKRLKAKGLVSISKNVYESADDIQPNIEAIHALLKSEHSNVENGTDTYVSKTIPTGRVKLNLPNNDTVNDTPINGTDTKGVKMTPTYVTKTLPTYVTKTLPTYVTKTLPTYVTKTLPNTNGIKTKENNYNIINKPIIVDEITRECNDNNIDLNKMEYSSNTDEVIDTVGVNKNIDLVFEENVCSIQLEPNRINEDYIDNMEYLYNSMYGYLIEPETNNDYRTDDYRDSSNDGNCIPLYVSPTSEQPNREYRNSSKGFNPTPTEGTHTPNSGNDYTKAPTTPNGAITQTPDNTPKTHFKAIGSPQTNTMGLLPTAAEKPSKNDLKWAYFQTDIDSYDKAPRLKWIISEMDTSEASGNNKLICYSKICTNASRNRYSVIDAVLKASNLLMGWGCNITDQTALENIVYTYWNAVDWYNDKENGFSKAQTKMAEINISKLHKLILKNANGKTTITRIHNGLYSNLKTI